MGGFLFDFDTAVMNGAVDAIRARFGLTPAVTGVSVACALVGSALGDAAGARGDARGLA